MTKITILLFLMSFAVTPSAQKANEAEAVNTCFGAVNIFESGEFKLQFTGNKGVNVSESYPSLAEISDENQLWCTFIAPANGELTFNASKKDGFLQMVVFAEERNDVCGEIEKGVAEIKRLHIKKDQAVVGLDYQIGGGVLYALQLNQGDKISVLFATNRDSKDKLNLDWLFNPQEPVESETKIVDKRNDDFAPTFSIKVRDSKTKEPLIANLTIENGPKTINALYNGSDFYFNIDRSCKITIKCDVEGYFFDDRIETVTAFDDFEVVIDLETLASGKSIAIEEVEFTPGTSIFTKASEPKLKRLKDFLLLNADLNVEIQGHVFALGDNSIMGQRVSEARAKRVVKYLVDNGVDKHRLKAVGYGNTQPVFEKPQFSYEEQANRRVEVMIL